MSSHGLSEWSPLGKHVQASAPDGKFASSKFTLIAAGPPRLADVGGSVASAGALTTGLANQVAMPIGFIQNWSLNQTKNFSRIFEIGSQRSYFIGGHSVGQVAIGRTVYHGPSLLRMIYAYYQNAFPPSVIEPVFANIGALNMANPHIVQLAPGYENIFLNMASDLFDQPTGLLWIIKDNDMESIGANYLECCVTPSHNIGTDSQGGVIQESSMLQFERIVPVAVSMQALIKDTISGLFS